ncbi:hypothetical protein [Homoserinibacter sp. GY 40078]|uniref:hypothetical protein n=1 Tax=Homoserinibacter sp. GY 40078 TaxID=2603275 RepID=UPI0011C82E3A|nr:hypothetical protein [Homoserinibacter sp. GY 40078]TXK19686.1 hypothetical protein FVQ89_07405 [Homoserinibacter sp. GY 40078]
MSDESDEFDDEFTPWTAEGAEQLRAAARAASDAILAHAERVAALSGDAQTPKVFESALSLAEVIAEFTDAQYAYTGTTVPLGAIYSFIDAMSENEEPEAVDVPGISVYQRRDYEVLDEESVMQAGRDAFREAWPDATDEDAAADVTTLGGALYQIAHAGGGWSALDRVQSLGVTGATVIVVPTEVTLGSDPDSWPEDPFEDADIDEAIYGQSDVFVAPPRDDDGDDDGGAAGPAIESR